MCDTTGHHHDSSRELQYVKSRRALLRRGAGLFAFVNATQIGTILVRGGTPDPTPRETEGPFWLDGATQRQDLRTDVTTGRPQAGFPLKLAILLTRWAKGNATPISGARIDLWQANASGHYSDEPDGLNGADTLGTTWLRGWQLTDAKGSVSFTTIYPMFYNGRSPHIHVRVRQMSGSAVTTNFTTQLFFDDAVSTKVYAANHAYASAGPRTYNEDDRVYTSVGRGQTDCDGARTTVKLAADNSHATGSFNIILA